jgi:hypothetical protein
VGSVAQRTAVEVAHLGELVVLRIGNVAVSLHFALALQTAADMRAKALLAKATAGVSTIRRTVVGILSDASADAPTPNRWNRSHPPEIKFTACRDHGTQVQLVIAGRTATMGWEAALAVSKWLRVCGKVARNAAGEAAPWHQLAGREV